MRSIRDPLSRSGTTIAATLVLVGALACILQAGSISPIRADALQSRTLLAASTRRKHLELAPRAINITHPAVVHGWVKKAGPLDPIHWHNDLGRDRRDQFNEWHRSWKAGRRAREQGEGQQALGEWLPAPPKAIFPPCQVFVNHRYKFIYMRQRKTGSMSLVNYLTECDAPNPGPACMDILSKDTPREEVVRLFSEYFVFTVVRNPFKRALSSYKFLLSRMHAQPPSCTKGLGWDAFCTDPMALGQRCRDRPECCFTSAGMFWAHIVEQARCMVAEGDSGWAVDYIGRTERMDEDVAVILREIDRRREPGAPAVSGSKPKAGPGGEDGEEEGRQGISGPGKLNVIPTCDPNGGWLQPFNRTVENVTYLAAVPQQQYCDEYAYFSGQHRGCMRTLRHFFQRDLQLLWGDSEAGQPSQLHRKMA